MCVCTIRHAKPYHVRVYRHDRAVCGYAPPSPRLSLVSRRIPRASVTCIIFCCTRTRARAARRRDARSSRSRLVARIIRYACFCVGPPRTRVCYDAFTMTSVYTRMGGRSTDAFNNRTGVVASDRRRPSSVVGVP